MNTNNNNNLNIKRDISRHVPSEWDFFFDSDKEIDTSNKKNNNVNNITKNQKIKKAFICGNSYEEKYHFDKDATRVSDILKDKLGYNCTLVLNEPQLKLKFIEFLNSFKYTETNVEFIFYFSGLTQSKKNGLELELEKNNEINNNNKKKKSIIYLNEIVELVDQKVKDIESSSLKTLDQFSFKKLFILECCRLKDDSAQDQYVSILKKYPRPIESQFKESKNTAFFYSSNLGKFSSEKDPLSTFTESLIARMTSKRAPGRDLNTVSEIIQEDLYNQYKKSLILNPIDYNQIYQQQYKIWFSSLNMFSIDINGSGNIVGNGNSDKNQEQLSSEVVHQLFEKFLKDKFNIFFGDIESMGKFILVENEDPLEIKKKQKQQYLKNRRCVSPSPSSSPNLKVIPSSPNGSPNLKLSNGIDIHKSSPSLLSNSNGSPAAPSSPSPSSSSRCNSPSWSIGINISKSAPSIPHYNSTNNSSLSQSPKLLVLGINKSTKFHINEASSSPNTSPTPNNSDRDDEELTNINNNGNGGSGNSSSSSLSPTLMANNQPINLLERIENQLSMHACGGSVVTGGFSRNDDDVNVPNKENWRVFHQYNKCDNQLI